LRSPAEQPPDVVPADAGRRGPVGHGPVVDQLDRRIIEALQANGRESFRRIAGRVGVSR
jgi:hypothetical protein